METALSLVSSWWVCVVRSLAPACAAQQSSRGTAWESRKPSLNGNVLIPRWNVCGRPSIRLLHSPAGQMSWATLSVGNHLPTDNGQCSKRRKRTGSQTTNSASEHKDTISSSSSVNTQAQPKHTSDRERKEREEREEGGRKKNAYVTWNNKCTLQFITVSTKE